MHAEWTLHATDKEEQVRVLCWCRTGGRGKHLQTPYRPCCVWSVASSLTGECVLWMIMIILLLLPVTNEVAEWSHCRSPFSLVCRQLVDVEHCFACCLPHDQCVAWWFNGESIELATLMLRVRLLAVPLWGNCLRQVVHTCASVTKLSSSMNWYWSQGSGGKITIGLLLCCPCITDASCLST